MITPTLDTIDEAVDTFSLLADLVNSSLDSDEYLWFQSLPCILPYWDKIPIAQYSENGKASQKYREDLAKKYGANVFVALSPTSRHPTSPGPTVPANADISSGFNPD